MAADLACASFLTVSPVAVVGGGDPMSQSSAPDTLVLYKSISSKIIGSLLASLVLLQVWFGIPPEPAGVVGWTVMATLSWHLLFSRQVLIVDTDNNLLSHITSSLYLIRRQDIQLDTITALIISKNLVKRGRFSLVVMLKSGKQLDLIFGSKTKVNKLGLQLSELTQFSLEQG